MGKFCNYKSCTDYLFNLERVGIKYDLKNIKRILDYISHPEKNFKAIHIAGTNGKGSVASIINSVFIERGLKTGLYTSPHIRDFRERILTDGKMIGRDYVTDFTNRLYDLFEEIKPSFFEATTAMAFEFFANQKVEYAVIEAGLGGRLDSTNVLKPELSVITGISIDHTEYLGNEIENIAYEKGGIVKKNIPCVAGKLDNKARNIIEKICMKKNSEFIYAEDFWITNLKVCREDGMLLSVVDIADRKNKISLEIPLTGRYQLQNIKTAFTALDIIGKKDGLTLSENNIKNGLKNITVNSRFYGRFQKISEKPKIVIDVSHNVQGIKNIKDSLKFIKYKRLYVIFGMMKDKEHEKCLEEIEKLKATVILTKPKYKRAEEPEILFKSVRRKENFFISENINAAYKNVMKMANYDDLILITGSFFLVSDFLRSIRFTFKY